MCYQIATIDGINAANTTSACALARTEITQYRQSLAALEYKHARYVAATLYITRNRRTQEANPQLGYYSYRGTRRRGTVAGWTLEQLRHAPSWHRSQLERLRHAPSWHCSWLERLR